MAMKKAMKHDLRAYEVNDETRVTAATIVAECLGEMSPETGKPYAVISADAVIKVWQERGARMVTGKK
jgi:hypothetical protein